MKTFRVNQIQETKNATHGAVGVDMLVLDNCRTMFGVDKTNSIVNLTTQNQDFYFIERFCQYVGLVRFEVGNGFSMMLSDFKDNVDNVLDEYLTLSSKGWETKDKDKFVKIYQEIASDKKGELARMVVEPLTF